MQITKRNGNIVDFDKQKIVLAIEKSMMETEQGIDHKLALRIANDIEKECLENTMFITSIDIEKIQDMVEDKLIKSKRCDVGKRYILYRNERAKLRENPKWETTDLQKAIWENKYRYNNETFTVFLNRVSNGDKDIEKLILHRKFLPAGRILAGRGLHKNGKKVTLSNCYVLPPPEDNIESIFDTAKEMARTYSWGGGVGIDISKLRPKDTKVNNASNTTSGTISFMDLYDLTTKLIGQKGRRGALMITLDCKHPDIVDFINCKTDLNKVTKANISIRFSDNFMKAVESNSDWELYFKVESTGEEITKIVKAHDVFKLFCKNDWNYAEPSAVFWDRIKSWCLLSEDKEFEFVGLNPCAEEPLPPYGSCNLSAINLSEFVDFPFTDKAIFNFDKFDFVVRKAVNYMNDILDEAIANNLYPIKKQKQMVIDWRQIGIGVMGIADMLIKLGIKYGSKNSLDICDKIGFKMINSALQESALLAKEKGIYPKYKEEAILNSRYLKYNAFPETIELIKKYGLRNSQLLTIAPNGTGSTMWGISGGIEPLFAISYTRKTESLHDEDTEYKVFTPIVKEYMDIFNIQDESNLPDYFITSHDLNFYERIDMQAIWQTHIDASISSTINLPFATPVKQVEDLYMYAWNMELKGVTIYRDGCKREGILTMEENKHEYEKANGICQDCGSDKLIKSGGCVLCLECGFSPCSV